MKRGPIHLHIDELTLHGFNPADRHQIADAVERELAAVLAQQTWGPADAGRKFTLDRVNAGEFAMAGLTAPKIGEQVAHAVSGSIAGACGGAGSSAMIGRTK